MRVTCIAALDENRLLAGREGIPWRLPRDSRHFKQTTNGHHLLLGRTTYEEMEGWFDRHIPLVLSRRENYAIPAGWPGRVVQDPAEALGVARAAGKEKLFIGGGAQVYALCLPLATRLLLTRVEHAFPTPPGAVYFPQVPLGEWALRRTERFPADQENPYPFRIEDWERVHSVMH
jgi:dihydrofolate reductase